MYTWEIEQINKRKLVTFPLTPDDGCYLCCFIDGIYIMNERDYRLELVTEHCWMNEHMMEPCHA